MDFAPILKFLNALGKNNNREWFEKNKPRFIEAKTLFDGFVAAQLQELTRFDESLAGLDPRKLTFRIYRDVRFSKDKRPYKTNFGAAFSATGKGLGRPGYYLHIESGQSFVAGGLFQPMPDVLARVRQEIDYNGDSLRKIMQSKKFSTLFPEFWDEDKLKTMPKGFAKDHPYGDWLKLKSFIVTHNFKDKEVLDKKFLKATTDAFKTVKPLNDFLSDALVSDE
jgi:uncharacterized protein (TIGR02453 family)